MARNTYRYPVDGPMAPEDMQATTKRGPASRAMGIPRNVATQSAINARRMREEAGDEPMVRKIRNPRTDSADVPRRTMNPEGDVIININKKEMAHGGYVCSPNARTGNIDMRKDKGMVRSVRNNLKKK